MYTLILQNLNTLNKNYFKFDVCRYEKNIFKHRITLVIVLHLFIRLAGIVKDIIGNMDILNVMDNRNVLEYLVIMIFWY